MRVQIPSLTPVSPGRSGVGRARSSVRQSDGLRIRRSQVRSLPGVPTRSPGLAIAATRSPTPPPTRPAAAARPATQDPDTDARQRHRRSDRLTTRGPRGRLTFTLGSLGGSRIPTVCRRSAYAPVAQLDRASDSGSEGQRFKSSRAYQARGLRAAGPGGETCEPLAQLVEQLTLNQ